MLNCMALSTIHSTKDWWALAFIHFCIILYCILLVSWIIMLSVSYSRNEPGPCNHDKWFFVAYCNDAKAGTNSINQQSEAKIPVMSYFLFGKQRHWIPTVKGRKWYKLQAKENTQGTCTKTLNRKFCEVNVNTGFVSPLYYTYFHWCSPDFPRLRN